MKIFMLKVEEFFFRNRTDLEGKDQEGSGQVIGAGEMGGERARRISLVFMVGVKSVEFQGRNNLVDRYRIVWSYIQEEMDKNQFFVLGGEFYFRVFFGS